MRVSAVHNRRKGKKDARFSEGEGWERGDSRQGHSLCDTKVHFLGSVFVRITRTFLGWGSLWERSIIQRGFISRIIFLVIALKIILTSIPKLLREKVDNASRKTILAEAKFREAYLAKPRILLLEEQLLFFC